MGDKRREKNQIDMLSGSLFKKILLFALPLAATSIMQQLFNSADMAVAGTFAGSEALAAVGSTSPLISLLVNLFVGIAMGSNVVIATYIGQGRPDEISGAVHTSLCLAGIGGILVMLIGVIFARPLVVLIGAPEDILDLAALYIRIFFIGVPFNMIYNFGASILRSKGDSRRPMFMLMISGVVNIGLNLVFVIVFHMSVAGVAVATVIANILNFIMMMRTLTHEEGDFRVRLKNLRISKKHMMRILKIGIPSGIQGMVFSLSNVCLQSGINSFGSDVVAGSAAAVNFEFISFFMLNAFTQACTTFTGQNFGASKTKRCDRVLVICLFMSAACTLTSNICCWIFRGPLVGLFTSDAAVVPYAYERLRRVLLFQSTICLYDSTGGALRGMGHSLTPSVITVFGTCVVRIVWVFLILKAGMGYAALLNAYPITWIITGVAVMVAYFIVRRREYSRLG